MTNRNDIWLMLDEPPGEVVDVAKCFRALNCYYHDWTDYFFNHGAFQMQFYLELSAEFYAGYYLGKGYCPICERALQRYQCLTGRFTLRQW